MTIQYLAVAARGHKHAALFLSRLNSVSLMVNGISTFSQNDIAAVQSQLDALFRNSPSGAIKPRRIVIFGTDNPALGWMLARIFPEASITRFSDAPQIAKQLLQHPYLQMYAGPGTIASLSSTTPSSDYDLAIFDSVPPLSLTQAKDISSKVANWVTHNTNAHFLFVCHKDIARETPVPAPQYFLSGRGAFLERLASWSSRECFCDALMRCWFDSQCRYPYADNTLLIEFDDLPNNLKCDSVVPEWVSALVSQYHLVVYINSAAPGVIRLFTTLGFETANHQMKRYVYTYTPEHRKVLHEKLAKLPMAELLGRFEAIYCAPNEHPAIKQLLGEYLERHSVTFFDQSCEPKRLMQQSALFYLYRDPAGAPIGLVKLINHVGWREGEILFGKGTHRQNVAMLLCSFLEDSKVGIKELEINVPYQHVGTMLTTLGAEATADYCVLRRRADAP